VLENALEAMDDVGQIEIVTSIEGQHAVVSVRDSGRGVPGDILENVFDPGVSTKSQGLGPGLGLAISRQIMEEHGGDIQLKSTPGAGATVVMRFPLTASGGGHGQKSLDLTTREIPDQGQTVRGSEVLANPPASHQNGPRPTR
jgi:signal transduction histidine kinase